MPGKIILLCTFLFAAISGRAQSTVSGTVYDNDNKNFPLELVTVKNLSNQLSTGTNDKGRFSITAKTGDLLEFSKPGFTTDTLLLVDLKPKVKFLAQKVVDINAVDINATKISPMLNTKDPTAKEYKRLYTEDVNKKKNTDRAGGINLSLGYGKYRREQAKQQQLSEQEQLEEEIRNNFNEVTVYDLLKLTGQELKDFIDMYRPTYNQVKLQRPFNYSYYMVTSYHAWQKLPPAQRKLPPLPKIKGNP